MAAKYGYVNLMTCMKCNQDLKDCWCKDLPKRLEAVSKVVIFDPDYLIVCAKQARRVEGMNDLKAI